MNCADEWAMTVTPRTVMFINVQPLYNNPPGFDPCYTTTVQFYFNDCVLVCTPATTSLLLSNHYPFTAAQCYDAFERDLAVFTYFQSAGYYRALLDQLHYHGITPFNYLNKLWCMRDIIPYFIC